jgi:hypothetical protein
MRGTLAGVEVGVCKSASHDHLSAAETPISGRSLLK